MTSTTTTNSNLPFSTRLGQGAVKVGEFATAGAHAVPAAGFAVKHRVLNIGISFLSFCVLQYLCKIVFAMDTEGRELKREDVPSVLHPLYGILHYDRFSDANYDRLMHVAHQLVPAIGAGVGAVAGTYTFMSNNGAKDPNKINEFKPGTSDKYKATMDKVSKIKAGDKNTKLGLLEASDAASYARGPFFAIVTGLFATLGAPSGLGFLNGLFLNPLFTMMMGRTSMLDPLSRHTVLPYGAGKSLEAEAKKFITNNREKVLSDPSKLQAFVEAMYKRLIPDIDPKHIQELTENLKAAREAAINDPQNAKAALEKVAADFFGEAGIEKFIKDHKLEKRVKIGQDGVLSRVSDFFSNLAPWLFGAQNRRDIEAALHACTRIGGGHGRS